MKKIISIISLVSIVFGTIGYSPATTLAAPMTISVTPATGVVSTSTATDVTLTWTVGTQNGVTSIATGSTVVLKVKNSSNQVIAGALTACTAPTGVIAGASTTPVYTTGQVTFTFASTTSNTSASACIKVPAGLVADIYSVTMTSGAPAFDAGAVAIYAGGKNVVNVEADVDPQFTFTLSGNSCNLGVLSTLSTSTCSYSGTSTSNTAQAAGIVIKAAASNPGGSNGNLYSTSGTIAPLAVNANQNPVAGTAYNGIKLSGLTGFAGYSGGGYNYTTTGISGFDNTTDTVMQSTSGAGGSFTINHYASASNSTAVGHYVQTVTWTATLSF